MFAGGTYMPRTLWKAIQRVRDVLYYGQNKERIGEPIYIR
jgi:hypothetical protein